MATITPPSQPPYKPAPPGAEEIERWKPPTKQPLVEFRRACVEYRYGVAAAADSKLAAMPQSRTGQ